MVSVLTISGMVAVHAKRAVFTALSGVAGLTAADVARGRAVVEHGDDVDEAAIIAAIESVGCSVTSIERVARRSLPIDHSG
jgi:hypothetical protein